MRWSWTLTLNFLKNRVEFATQGFIVSALLICAWKGLDASARC